MSLSMKASCNGCERYSLICYQQIYWATYLWQSLLEPGPSLTRLEIGCYSYKGINSGTIHIDYGYYSGECDEKMGISNIIQKGVGWKV